MFGSPLYGADRLLFTVWGSGPPVPSNLQPLSSDMVMLGREDLDVWLDEPEDFVLAVLRDIYACDAEVKRWLNTPHPRLEGQAPTDLLSAGRVTEVESILIQEWNAQ